MKRFTAHVSLNLSLAVVFMTIFMVLPTNAFAFSWPFAGGGVQAPQISEGNADKVVAETSAAVGLADFSEGLAKGVGFRYESESGAFVDFRLKDSLSAVPVQLSAFTVFVLPGGDSVKYTTTQNQIKEEIILEALPETDTIPFDVTSSNLTAVKTPEGGYSFLESGGATVFEVPPPFAYDSNGATGAVDIDINKGEGSLKVDPDFLRKAAYPVTVDPSVVASHGGGNGYSSQHNTFYDGNRYWVFYSDGNNLLSKSSTDGVNWPVSGQTVASGVTDGIYASTWYAGGNKVYVAYGDAVIYAKSGTISSDTITWSAASTVFSGAQAYSIPSITVDSSGKIWATARFGDKAPYVVKARRSTNADNITAWDAIADVSPSTTETVVVPQVVPLANNAAYFIYSTGAAIKGRSFDGTSTWGSITAIAQAGAADTAHLPSALVKDNTVTLGYSAAGDNLKYKTLASPFTSSSADQTLTVDVGQNVALSYDQGGGDIYAFYTHTIGAAGKQLRQVKFGEANRKTLLSPAPTPFAYVEAQRADGTNRDVTIAARDDTAADVYNSSGFLVNAANEGLLIGSEQKFDYINVSLSQASSGGVTLAGKYWNGTSFVSVTITDETKSLKNLSGFVYFTPPADWKPDSTGLYKFKLYATNAPTGTKPIGSQIAPYEDMSQVVAAYSSNGDPFVIWREVRGATGTTRKTRFSAYRGTESLGAAGLQPNHSHSLKTAATAVNLSNGNLALSVGGPSTPSRGLATAPTFTYNSQSQNEGVLGYGWTSNLLTRLFVGWTDKSVLYQNGAGARHLFDYNESTGLYDGPPELHVSLTRSGNDYLLKTKDQLIYTFDSSGTLRTTKDRNNNTATYNYDSEGKLTTVVSASNTTTTLAYDESVNRVTSITDAAGRSMLLSYDTSGNLTTIKDALNNTTTVGYDANHNLTGYTDARSYTTGFTYANDKVVKITDPSPLSYQTAFTYNNTSTVVNGPRTDVTDTVTYNLNPSGLLIALTEPSPGGATSYQYDGDFNSSRIVKANSATTTDTYDANGNLLTETDPMGAVTRYAYNAKNDVVSTTDALGRNTAYSYDTTGNLQYRTDSLTHRVSYTYDEWGQKASMTNERDFTWAFEHNALGQETTVTDPLTHSSSRAYDSAGNLTAETDALRHTTTHRYDALGQETTTTMTHDGDTMTVSYKYDAVGNRTEENKYGRVTTFEYDALSRLTKQTTGARVLTFAYDAAGNKTAETNPLSKTTTFAYDALDRETSSTDPLHHTSRSAYDIVGNVTTETNALNKSVRHEYDLSGRETTVTDPLGYKTSTAYNAAGEKTAETDAEGNTTLYGYDALGRLTVTTDPLSNAVHYAYDAAGNKTSETDKATKTTYFGYDQVNRLITSTSTIEGVTQTGYDALGRTVVTTDAVGAVSRIDYDDMGRVTTETNPNTDTKSYTYDDFGNRVSETDENRDVTRFIYDVYDQVIKTIDPKGHISYFDYDLAGRAVSEGRQIDLGVSDFEDGELWGGGDTDTVNHTQGAKARKLTAGLLSAATYRDVALDLSTDSTATTDAISLDVYVPNPGVLAAVPFEAYFYTGSDYYYTSRPDTSFTTGWNSLALAKGSFTAYGAPDWGHITKVYFRVSASFGNSADFTLDNIRFASAREKLWTKIYDDAGRLYQAGDAMDATATYEYDAADRLTKEIAPDDTSSTKTYDDNGRVTIDTDEMGKETTYAYDGEARVTAVKDPLGHVTKREYDELGRESTVTAPSTHQTVYKYGPNGKKTDVYTPGGRHYIMTHDDMGRLKTSKEGTQAATEFDYDKESNRTRIITPGSVITTNTYDPDGNLDKTIDPLGAIDYGYSADSNLTTVTMPNNVATGFGYDPADNVTSTTVGSEALMSAAFDTRNNFISGGTTTDTVDTVYNRLNQPVKTVESATGRVTSDTLDIMGRLTSRFDKTGLTKYFYNDPRGLTTKIIDPESHETTYSYNSASAPIGIKQDNGIVTTLGYNIDSQNTTISSVGGAFSLVFGYQYDLDGLITTETVDGSQTIYAYDKLSRLVSWRPPGATETAYVYGLDGDRTSMTDSSGTTTYSYDAGTHQLRSSSGPSGDIAYDYDDNGELKHKVTAEGTTTYDWNDKGQLTKVTMPDSTATFTYDARGNRTKKDVNGTVTNYVYDGLKLIAEKDASGSVTAAYTYDTGGRLISVYKNSNTYYYHLNQRGDVIKITDQSKNVVASYSYDPWGNILSATGSFATEQPFRYAGYMWDAETGLYFLSARYYDPTTGRFISRDSEDIGDVTPAINPYVYAEGNPVSFVDPTGLDISKGNPNNDKQMVKHVKWALANMGYRVQPGIHVSSDVKPGFGQELYDAVCEFQKTHLAPGGTGRLKVDGIVGPDTLAAIEFWNRRKDEPNNAVQSFASAKGEVAVYAFMDPDWADRYANRNTNLANVTFRAPGKQQIRRLFYHVNHDWDKRSDNARSGNPRTGDNADIPRDRSNPSFQGFPGGKFYVYDIGLEAWGHASPTTNRIINLAFNARVAADWKVLPANPLLANYELLAAFSGLIFEGGPPGTQTAFTPFTRDQVTLTYRANPDNAIKQLKHELGHFLGANEHNSRKCIMDQGPIPDASWSEYHWNFFTNALSGPPASGEQYRWSLF